MDKCERCGREKAQRHDDRERCARGLSPGLLDNLRVCMSFELARVKEERDAAQEHVKELRERIGTLDVDAYLPRAQDAEARVRELEQRLATQAESLGTAQRMEREARARADALEETLKDASNAASFDDCVSILDVALRSFQPGHQHGPRAPTRHMHQAGPDGDRDRCRLCGLDLRDEVHARAALPGQGCPTEGDSEAELEDDYDIGLDPGSM